MLKPDRPMTDTHSPGATWKETPLRTHPKFVGIVRDIVSGAQDVCFRDKASYELFKDIPSVRVATDIAFTLNTGMFESVPKQTKTVLSWIPKGGECVKKIST